MRLVRYSHGDEELFGTVDGDTIHEIDIDASDTAPPIVTAARAGSVEETGNSVGLDEVRVRAPIERPGKIVAVGLNYNDHAEEGGNELPDAPMLFGVATSAVIGPDDPIIYPYDIEQLDYEAELAIVIGDTARRVSADDATEYIAGFTSFNDVTARDIQYSVSQFHRGKSFDTFAPMGPVLVTPDELDPTDLSIRATVNGETRQDSSTANMIFDVPTLVESISQTMTLYPGDVIATGTPEGVGVHSDPQTLLEVGDTVTIELEGVGSLSNPIVAEES